jgi:hypothetical protein
MGVQVRNRVRFTSFAVAVVLEWSRNSCGPPVIILEQTAEPIRPKYSCSAAVIFEQPPKSFSAEDRSRMVRKMDLLETAADSSPGTLRLRIMSLRDAESPGSIPVRTDGCRQLDEPTSTTDHRLPSARRTGFYASNSAGGEYVSATTSVVGWPLRPKG